MMNLSVMETQLSGEYREVFKRAQMYATLKNMENQFFDDKMLELFDLLLTAQNEGKPASRLIGSDVSRFCKDYFSDYTIAERLRFLPVTLYRISWFVFVLELIEFFACEIPMRDFFAAKADMSGYGVGALVAIAAYIVADVILLPIFRRSKKVNMGVWYGVLLGVIALLLAVSFPLGDRLTLMLPVWPFLLGSALYIIAYIVARAIWRYRNFGTIRNARKQLEQDSYYKNLEDRDLEKILLEAWKKRFARLQKQGKVTEESYLEELTKNENLEGKIFRYVTPLIYIAICIFSIVQVARDSGLADSIFFAVFISVITFFIYRWLYRIEAKNAALRRKHLDNCRAQGKTMPDYIEESLVKF